MKLSIAQYLSTLLFITTMFSTSMTYGAIYISEDVVTTSSVRFHWDAVENAESYIIWVGGTPDLKDYGAKSSKNTTATVDRLPTDGSILHTTLRARINGRWQIVDRGSSTAATKPLLYWPKPSTSTTESELVLPVSVFKWRSAVAQGDTTYLLMAGTSVDPDAYARRRIRPSDLEECDEDCDQFDTLVSLPIDGSDIWVTLAWLDDTGRWRREKPQRYVAGSRRAIVYPAPGSQLEGSAINFSANVGNIGAEKYRWRIGTLDAPAKYGNWPLSNHMNITGLPVDGSGVVVRYDIFDGRRWVNVDVARYTAATGTPYLWGNCTNTNSFGLKAIGFKAYPGTPEWEAYAPHNRGGFFSVDSFFGTHPRHAKLLRDECASDTGYVLTGDPVFTPSIFISAREKGIYLWLNNGSGAAKVKVVDRGAEGPVRLFALPPNDGNPRPIFMPLPPNEKGYFVFFYPLNEIKPVRLSEIRMARSVDDVSTLPKLRFNGVPSYNSKDRQFVALSGDPRARVTAEIVERFGPVATHRWHERSPNCASFRWVDATWMLDKGIHFQHEQWGALHTTVWINWQLVTNAEIAAAIEHSINSGLADDFNQPACTPAPQSHYTIDWLAKARSALARTYDGPELFYEFDN